MFETAKLTRTSILADWPIRNIMVQDGNRKDDAVLNRLEQQLPILKKARELETG